MNKEMSPRLQTIKHLATCGLLIPALVLGTLGYGAYSYAQESENNDNQNALITAAVAAGAVAIAAALAARSAQKVVFHDFGGRIATIQPVCTAPTGALINLGPPTFSQLMYLTPGFISYSYGPPKSIGQSLLGRASTTPVPCMVLCPTGVCPHPQGGGFLILFHGSSAV